MKLNLEFLKEKLDSLVFVELKTDIKMTSNTKIDKDIPLPILADIVREKIHDSDPSFSQNELVDGIIFLLGLDPVFKYKEDYNRLLHSIDKNILEILTNQILTQIEDENRVNSFIKLAGICHLGMDNETMLINIGRLAVEIANMNEDEEFNQFSYRLFKYMQKKETKEPMPYYYLGYYYYNLGHYSEAKKLWEESIDRDLDDVHKSDLIEVFPKLKSRLYYEEGYNLIFKGRYDEGLEKLLAIKDEFSEWWNLFFFIGLAYRFKEEYVRALYYYERALEIDPSQVDVFNEIGICHTLSNENDKAIAIFNKALAIKPDHHEILCNIGIAYYNLGNIEIAKEFVKRSYQIEPEDEITKQWMGHLKIYTKD